MGGKTGVTPDPGKGLRPLHSCSLLQGLRPLLGHFREPSTVSKSTLYPFFTIGRDLLFPNGYSRLQGINDIATGIKSFGSMWRGDHNNDTGLTYL